MSILKFEFIAIDFDGTITTDHSLPFGTAVPRDHAIRVINKIHDHGGKIAIWTCRTGDQQDMVEDFLRYHQIPYHVINDNFYESKEIFGGTSRKILADCYIDDRCLFLKGKGLDVDWLEVESLLFEEGVEANGF